MATNVVSKKLRFNAYNLKRTAKVLAWSLASVVVLQVFNLLGQFEIPTEYTLLVPVVNSLLYAFNEFIRRQLKELK